MPCSWSSHTAMRGRPPRCILQVRKRARSKVKSVASITHSEAATPGPDANTGQGAGGRGGGGWCPGPGWGVLGAQGSWESGRLCREAGGSGLPPSPQGLPPPHPFPCPWAGLPLSHPMSLARCHLPRQPGPSGRCRHLINPFPRSHSPRPSPTAGPLLCEASGLSRRCVISPESLRQEAQPGQH